MTNQDAITLTISLTVLPQENGRYLCQISPTLTAQNRTGETFSGQTPEHALAVALEHLADEYRTAASQSQENTETVEASHGQEKRYHVILHYERIANEESKFEAMHNTLLGNTVVENAKCTVIEISPDAQQQVLS